MRSVSLSYTPQAQPLNGYTDTVAVTAFSGLNDDGIFVMRLRPLDPRAGTQAADFIGVANIQELTALPLNTVLPGSTRYRVSSITRVWNSPAQSAQAWAGVQTMVQQLLYNLRANDTLGETQTVTLTDS